jgi:hypothetical protein
LSFKRFLHKAVGRARLAGFGLVVAFASLGHPSIAGVPGGSLVEGVSDECDTVNPIWTPGLRGFPEYLSSQNGLLSIRSIDNGDDPYPSAEDMITTYSDQIGRSLVAAEKPSVVTWLWLPPFNEWPTGVNASGFREWLGFRVTAYDADLPENNGLYWPGIYIATDDNGPCLIARVGDGYAPDVTIGRISTSGWWTLGIAFSDDGRTEYYAAPGQVTLTSANLLHTTPISSDPAANRSIDELWGNFWALRMTYPPTGQLSPNWQVDYFRVFVGVPPPLPLITPSVANGQAQLRITGSARGFRYLLQRSKDLSNWTTLTDQISDGTESTFAESLTTPVFYRVRRP